MELTFRWFGEADPVELENIRQIPGLRGVVSALYNVPVGEVWPKDEIQGLAERINNAGLKLTVIESIPVHEDVKIGRATRDGIVENYCQSVVNMGEIGIPVLCYNFMPIFDWTRTNLAMSMPDGSNCLAYDHNHLSTIDLSRGTGDLPGWATTYDAKTLNGLLSAYKEVDEERLWDNLAYFLERVVPVAESVGVKMAIHPDDPPWPIFGLPRIVTSGAALERLIGLVDSPSNGVTFCAGSLAADPANNIPDMARKIGSKGRIHFAHCRNIKRTGDRQFHESKHPSEYGDVDMYRFVKALYETGFRGPARPDHGRMIWGETGRPGYGLYDRALGLTYLFGLWEGISRTGNSLSAD